MHNSQRISGHSSHRCDLFMTRIFYTTFVPSSQPHKNLFTMAAPVVPAFTAKEFLLLGFKVRRFEDHAKVKEESQIAYFKSLFGTVPDILELVWSEMRHTTLEGAKIDNKSAKPLHLLLFYRWMRSYETEVELRTQFGIGEETLRKWIRYMAQRVAALRAIVVCAFLLATCATKSFSHNFLKIDPNWQDDDGLLYVGALDGVHYPIDEPRPFSKSNSSFKRGGKAGLSYEFVLSIHKEKIMWVNGGFPAGQGDRSNFKDEGLMDALIKRRQETGRPLRLIADDGYTEKTLYQYLSLRNEFDPRQVAHFKDRALSRQEAFNGKTKNYRCLKNEFVHSHDLHRQCVEAICVTLQYEMDTGVLSLFDAYT